MPGDQSSQYFSALLMVGPLTRRGLTIHVERDTRVVSGTVVTSAGVSAGIDMAFNVVERLCGREVADETAHYIEYPRSLGTL